MHFNLHQKEKKKVGLLLCYRGGAQFQPICPPGVPAELWHLTGVRPGKDREGHMPRPALRGSNLLMASLVPETM